MINFHLNPGPPPFAPPPPPPFENLLDPRLIWYYLFSRHVMRYGDKAGVGKVKLSLSLDIVLPDP